MKWKESLTAENLIFSTTSMSMNNKFFIQHAAENADKSILTQLKVIVLLGICSLLVNEHIIGDVAE